MITRIIFNMAPNTTEGRVYYWDRTVGQADAYAYPFDKVKTIELEHGLKKAEINFRITYEGGVEEVIPYNHDIIYYEDNATDNEGTSE